MTGLVLAGGLSSRFGKDKSRVVVHGNAGDMVDFSLRLLGSLEDIRQVAVSCREEQLAYLKNKDAILIPDEHRGQPTPLRGLVAALRRVNTPILAIPCDLPLMTPDILALLLRARRRHLEQTQRFPLLRTTFIDRDGFLESLIGIYETASLQFLEDALRKQHWGIWSALPSQGNCLIPQPDSPAFLNMNTLQEYENAVRLLSEKA